MEEEIRDIFTSIVLLISFILSFVFRLFIVNKLLVIEGD